MDATARERTHTWSDPRTLAAAATGQDGLSFLRAMADGTLPPPPIMTLVGAGVESVEHGRVVFAVEPAEFHDNPIGSVHGGSTRRCSTPQPGAPSTALSRRASATRASTCR